MDSAGPSEALALAGDPRLELSEQWIRDAYARDCVCLGALARGEPVGYTWLAFGDTPYEDGIWIGLDERLRYTHKSFVRPECRAGGRVPEMLRRAAGVPLARRPARRHQSLQAVNRP